MIHNMQSIPRYLSTHRKVLLFLPIVLGLVFWGAAVVFAAESERDRPKSPSLLDANMHAVTVDELQGMVAYAGTYEKYGLRNRSKLLSTPFFDPDALQTVAIANAYRSKEILHLFDTLCPALASGNVAVAREGKSGKFAIVDLRTDEPPKTRSELEQLLAEDDTYLLTGAEPIPDHRPAFRLVAWDAEKPLNAVSDMRTGYFRCNPDDVAVPQTQ